MARHFNRTNKSQTASPNKNTIVVKYGSSEKVHQLVNTREISTEQNSMNQLDMENFKEKTGFLASLPLLGEMEIGNVNLANRTATAPQHSRIARRVNQAQLNGIQSVV